MKRLVLESGLTVSVGENARENQELVEEFLDTDFVWFHMKDFPSCHVIVEDERPTKDDINEAAQICKENTKYKFLKFAKVSYTTCSNLIPTKTPGTVMFVSNRKVLDVIPTPKSP